MVFGSRDGVGSSRGGSDRDRAGSSFRGGDRISKPYRSPPTQSRMPSQRPVYDEHRSRRDEDVSAGYLSKFYRDRFGSHSPEDYLNLRISQFDKVLSKEEIRKLLEREFKPLAPFEIKIVRNPEDDERLAYVNFERPDCAKNVRRNMIPRLQRVLGRRIALDPAGIIRDQEGKYIPDRYNRAAMAAAAEERGERAPPASLPRRRSPPPLLSSSSLSGGGLRGYGGGSSGTNGGMNTGRRRDTQFTNLNQDDTQATRTLFVGNLPADVRETELRRVFEIYGTVETVEIKHLSDATAAYAFILYNTVEEAIEARRCQHNKPARPGSSRCQIGYGKSQPSPRLYVGGLGAWTSREMLMNEFDRYGPIDIIEYEPGQPNGFIRYEDVEAATDACARMKNFDLGGGGKYITVDFTKDVRPRKRARSTSMDEYDSKRRNGPRTPSLSPARSPTEAGYIQTVDELREQVASTWKGMVVLKKCDYPLSLFRVFGKEHLLQDLLRDEAGNALRLSIVQRLPLTNKYFQQTIELGPRELALMIAVEGSRSSEPLARYLQEKDAAGVAKVPGGIVHIFPYSVIAERLVKFFAPRIALLTPTSNHLLFVLKKQMPDEEAEPSSSQQSTNNTQRQSWSEVPPAAVQQPQSSTFSSGTFRSNNAASYSLSELPPPPPLPFLVKREPVLDEHADKAPLNENRSAPIQLQIRVKQENGERNVPALTRAPPLPPPPSAVDVVPPLLTKKRDGGDRHSGRRGDVSDDESSSGSDGDDEAPQRNVAAENDKDEYEESNSSSGDEGKKAKVNGTAANDEKKDDDDDEEEDDGDADRRRGDDVSSDSSDGDDEGHGCDGEESVKEKSDKETAETSGVEELESAKPSSGKPTTDDGADEMMADDENVELDVELEPNETEE